LLFKLLFTSEREENNAGQLLLREKGGQRRWWVEIREVEPQCSNRPWKDSNPEEYSKKIGGRRTRGAHPLMRRRVQHLQGCQYETFTILIHERKRARAVYRKNCVSRANKKKRMMMTREKNTHSAPVTRVREKGGKGL